MNSLLRSQKNENVFMVSPPLHFVTSVWGEQFCDTFLSVTLPCLLSTGNIPSISDKSSCVYKIFTSPESRKVIEQSAAVGRLRQYVDIEIRLIEGRSGNKYDTSSDCYRIATREAHNAGAATVYLIPDMVFADGGIASCIDVLRSGKRAILSLGLRTVRNTLAPELLKNFCKDGSICIRPRELVRLAIGHLHPITESHFYEGTSSTFHPAAFCWPVTEDGFVVHSFHLQPIALYPCSASAEFSGTIDDDLLLQSGFSEDQIHIVCDSDEILWFEMSDLSYRFPMPKRHGMGQIVNWMETACNQRHRWMFQHAIRIHSGEVDTPTWNSVEAQAKKVAQEVLSAYEDEQRGLFKRGSTQEWLVGIHRFARRLTVRAQSYLDTEGVLIGQFPWSLFKLFVAGGIVAGVQVYSGLSRITRRVVALLIPRSGLS